MEMTIEKVLEGFGVSGMQSCSAFDSGLINKSYHIKADSKQEYVLQKINASIFAEAEKMMINVLLAQDFLRKEAGYVVPEILFTVEGKPLFKDEEGEKWRLMRFIPGSFTYDSTDSPEVALETGRILGKFHYGTGACPVSKMHVTLPKFHDLHFRTEWFLKGLGATASDRLAEASECIAEVERLLDEEELNELEEMELPIRVTHNDTKLNNVLFDQVSGKALCLIDLDTIMPGYLCHDFGDTVRTLCNTTEEDERNLDLVTFNFELFTVFLKGYTSVMGSSLSNDEWKSLKASIVFMPFIMAIRFLTDFLFEDRYYKTDYHDHNLVRCMNQLRLIEEIKLREAETSNSIDAIRKDFS